MADRSADDCIRVADVVRAVRRNAGMSQRDLATHAGVPASTVGRIEASRSDDVLVSTLLKLIDATEHAIVVVDEGGAPIDLRHPQGKNVAQYRDLLGRRLPAHLRIFQPLGEGLDRWWGWRHIAWELSDRTVPGFSYNKRDVF